MNVNIFDVQRYSIHDGPGIRTTVFMKGCPLRCLWCHNPESNRVRPQLMTYANLCTACGACVSSCPMECIRMENNACITDRSRCTACGLCVSACPQQARAISGRIQTVDEIVKVAWKDRLYYKNSGGGVTLSGGEPLMQAEAAAALTDALHEKGLHVAIETCGYAPWEQASKVFSRMDLILYDLKHMDSAKHRELTGVGNELIHENLLRIVSETKAPIWLRLPLIASVNDSSAEFEAIAAFAKPFQDRVEQVWLLPYHALGTSKLESLGESTDKLNGFAPPTKDHMQKMADLLINAGFNAVIG
ncbi:MAG: glycyl-radical enzyme activating protein [Clostridia bacterium]|nr:glycyl-radical enzyme activating protein [Clostridia bacterium]